MTCRMLQPSIYLVNKADAEEVGVNLAMSQTVYISQCCSWRHLFEYREDIGKIAQTLLQNQHSEQIFLWPFFKEVFWQGCSQ